MDWNLLNQNHFARVKQVLEGLGEAGKTEPAGNGENV